MIGDIWNTLPNIHIQLKHIFFTFSLIFRGLGNEWNETEGRSKKRGNQSGSRMDFPLKCISVLCPILFVSEPVAHTKGFEHHATFSHSAIA